MPGHPEILILLIGATKIDGWKEWYL